MNQTTTISGEDTTGTYPNMEYVSTPQPCVCPTCGTCPTCGHKRYTYPSYPYTYWLNGTQFTYTNGPQTYQMGT